MLARKLSWLFCGGHGTFLSTGATRYFDAPRKNGFAYAALAVTKFYEKKNILELYGNSDRRTSRKVMPG